MAWADRRRRLIAPLTTRMDGWTAQVHQTWQKRPGGWHLPSVARTGAIQGTLQDERLPGPKFLTVPKVFGSARNTPKPAKPETPDGQTLASANVMKR